MRALAGSLLGVMALVVVAWAQPTPVPVEIRSPAPQASPSPAASPRPSPLQLGIVSHSIWAPNEMVKHILVTVNVKNYGKTPVEGASVEITLTPEGHVRHAHAPGDAEHHEGHVPSAMDPVVINGPLTRLEPGQARDFVFETPYMASNAFRTSASTVVIDNLVPNLRHSVTVRLDLKLLPP